jgi:hypothetical protein
MMSEIAIRVSVMVVYLPIVVILAVFAILVLVSDK